MADWTLAFLPAVPILDACEKATAAGFKVWTPSIVEKRRRPGRRGQTRVTVPAYPGYLFAGGIDLDRLRRRFEGWRLRPLEDWTVAQVDALKALEAEWNEAARQRQKAGRQRFQPGAAVVIAAGIFVGRAAVVERDDGGQLVKVAIEVDAGFSIGRLPEPGKRWRRVSMPAACLAAFGESVAPGTAVATAS